MLSKEEYLKALSVVENHDDVDELIENRETIENLIEEHFELLEVLKDCGWGELTPASLRIVIEASQYNAKKLNELRNNPPLKFEELKPNMWVWDEKNKMCLRICKTKEKENIKDLIVVGGNQYWIENFEENRFFPVQMANVRCE